MDQAGSATELFLNLLMSENATVTSQKRADDTLPQMPQSRALDEKPFIERVPCALAESCGPSWWELLGLNQLRMLL